jgi:hypothetical protein
MRHNFRKGQTLEAIKSFLESQGVHVAKSTIWSFITLRVENGTWQKRQRKAPRIPFPNQSQWISNNTETPSPVGATDDGWDFNTNLTRG